MKMTTAFFNFSEEVPIAILKFINYNHIYNDEEHDRRIKARSAGGGKQ